jgi:hypothetical protein
MRWLLASEQKGVHHFVWWLIDTEAPESHRLVAPFTDEEQAYSVAAVLNDHDAAYRAALVDGANREPF